VRNINTRALGAQRPNDSFLEIGFTGQTDFIVVRYSVTNSDLASNNPFRYEGNVDKVSRLCEIMYNVFVPIFFLCKES
jgi:hypothetical protein